MLQEYVAYSEITLSKVQSKLSERVITQIIKLLNLTNYKIK